jgi:hypothetical protein
LSRIERLRNAVLEIKRRLSEGLAPDYRAIADEFNVKPTTLFDRAKKRANCAWKSLEEKGLVQFVEKKAERSSLNEANLIGID